MAIDVPYLRAQLPRAMNRVTEGLGRVTKIVRAMKSFSHPSRCDMEPVDLNEALLTTLTVAYSEYKYVAVLETDLGELPLVTCHVNEFNQVIINLVVNAAHAIGDVVATSGDMGRIFIKTWRDGHDVILSLKDTGTGIPEYVREYIFEPFFTTKELGKGTGQGLAIAHAVIVEKHGGSLTFESKIGEGTTFFVRLPIDGPSPRGGGDGIT
jgi:signal transduction histidine kinase